MRLRPWSTLFVIGGLVIAPIARAEPTDEERGRARAAFEHARRLIQNGDCGGAIPELEESLRNEPTVGAHFSYADCLDASDPHRAWWELREAALVAFVKHDERFAVAEQRAAALMPRIGSVRLEVPQGDLMAPGFELRLDGKVIDRFHVATGKLAAAPGEHVVDAATPDGRRFSLRFRTQIGIGTLVVVELRATAGSPVAPLPAAKVSSPPPLSLEAPRGSTTRTLGVVLAGAGVVSVAVGAAYGIVTLQKKSELDRACNGDASACSGSSRAVDPVASSLDRNATASTIFFAAGGALVAAGVFLFVTAPSAKTSRTAMVTW